MSRCGETAGPETPFVSSRTSCCLLRSTCATAKLGTKVCWCGSGVNMQVLYATKFDNNNGIVHTLLAELVKVARLCLGR